MNIIFDDWQQQVLKAKGNIGLCTGRRVGKTLIFCEKAVNAMHNRPNIQVKIASLTEEQAIMINFWMTQIALDKYPEDIDYNKRPTQKTLTFNNGSNSLVRPVGQTGDSFRGFEGDIVYVDEAARMPKLFWKAITPLIMTKIGEIWMSSTPQGKEGYFWERFKEAVIDKDKEAIFKFWHISTEEVISNRKVSASWTNEQREFALKHLERERRTMTQLDYAQEYLAQFMEELTRLFPDELLDRCLILKRQQYKNNNFMGCDIAAEGGDETTFEVIHKIDDMNYWHTESIEKKQPTTDTENDIIVYMEQYKIDKCGIDTGGIGLPIFDRLIRDERTKRKVVSMSNRSASLNRDKTEKQKIFKEDMYENLKAMMERGELKLLNDDKVRASLSSVQKEYIENETTKEKRIIIHGNYTHIAEGLIRAAYLAKNEKINKLWVRFF